MFLKIIQPASQGNERAFILIRGGLSEVSVNWNPKNCIASQDTTSSIISCPRKPFVTDPQIS